MRIELSQRRIYTRVLLDNRNCLSHRRQMFRSSEMKIKSELDGSKWTQLGGKLNPRVNLRNLLVWLAWVASVTDFWIDWICGNWILNWPRTLTLNSTSAVPWNPNVCLTITRVAITGSFRQTIVWLWHQSNKYSKLQRANIACSFVLSTNFLKVSRKNQWPIEDITWPCRE